MSQPSLTEGIVAAPFGAVHIVVNNELEKVVSIRPVIESIASQESHATGLLAETIRQLKCYFDGSLQEFDLPLLWQGTDFQLTVWQALTRIPYGETISYQELAFLIDKPRACRAVGTANGRNQFAIVVPCHRVIAANGSLGGYTGGLGIKRSLLALEGVVFGD